MVLNKDILDAIRNQKYKLKSVHTKVPQTVNYPASNITNDTPTFDLSRGRRMYRSMHRYPARSLGAKGFDYKKGSCDDFACARGSIIANILRRRVSMEYMNESDDAEDEEHFSFL